jgi:type II secretory pathway component GspD/PulD (secretin)
VLDWFAEQAGLSLLMESPPPGTFNYTDTRSYSPTEALDVLNGVLLTKGYSLVRHGKMLVVVNLEDGVPPNLVPDVPLADLDSRGEYELVRVVFPVWNMTPEQAATEIQPLLGPQGKAVTLPQAREIQVTETGGRLRTIRSVVNAVEQPELGSAGMRELNLKYITFDAAMPTIRQMLGIPPEAFGMPDGSAQITKSATGEKILFRGTAQQAARLTEVLRLIDVPEAARGINGSPQLEVYSVTTADPDTVVKMLQTMLHNDPTVVLTADKEADQVLAFATPPQQATIKATINQMQKEAKQVDVINLSNVDPQVAVLAINKLFGSQGGKDDAVDNKAPRVDADITTRSLMVRGTASQVQQIRDLLHKLGENEDEGGGAAANKQPARQLRRSNKSGPRCDPIAFAL